MGVDPLQAPFQAEVARVALAAAAGHGFALAGGNALVAHGLVERQTQDVHLFSPEPGAPLGGSRLGAPGQPAGRGRQPKTIAETRRAGRLAVPGLMVDLS